MATDLWKQAELIPVLYVKTCLLIIESTFDTTWI